VTGTDVEASPGRERIGTKRGRLLMRQERIKKELDTHTSPDSEPGSPGFPRQRSTEPASPGFPRQRSTESSSSLIKPEPGSGPPRIELPIATSPIPSVRTHNLLSVPQVLKITEITQFSALRIHGSAHLTDFLA